jgi:hypothetical protein
MKYALVKCVSLCLLFSCSIFARSATTYRNLESSTLTDDGVVGWGSCITCAGGGSNNASIASSPFQTLPSIDGSSRDFYISGSAYSDALWWYKVGPNNAASNFTTNFYVNVSSSTQTAQALEFDTFQFVGGREYMFGTQCDYAAGTWDLWNGLQWVHSNVPCQKFKPNTWYQVILNVHRTAADQAVHYDNLTVAQYTPNGSNVVSWNWYGLNQAYPSQPKPAGWGDDLGVQFQLDNGSQGAQMQEWVDKVTLTAW